MHTEEAIQKLKALIETEVFVTAAQHKIMSSRGNESNWLFDFRRILMRAEVLELLGGIFQQTFTEKYPYQIGCLEVAGIPLTTGLSYALYTHGQPINAFFIRKSRKKHGLLNMIEGELSEDKIILVDDIINSGASFMRQVEVLEQLGKKIDTVYAILRFRDESFYTYFYEKGIKVVSLFTLDDFTPSLGVKNLVLKDATPLATPFVAAWQFKSEQPNHYYVVPKSAPVIDATKLYFGSDSGNFWALNQIDGTVVWKYKVGFHAKGKYIFSSPALAQQTVYFGAYDGNFYALDSETGKPRWIFMEADWIGSSPCLALKHNLVFVGLEFGLFNKKGGVVALDMTTGKKVWEFTTPGHVHSSPAYSKTFDTLVCGSNNNTVYAFAARTGKLLWECKTDGDVKESFAFSDNQQCVIFGSHDSYIYIVHIKTGEIISRIKTGEAVYSTPVVHQNHVYVTSLDKRVYCINLQTCMIVWTFLTSGRVFASPVVINNQLYVGSNDGRLYELALDTGANTAVFQATERITNQIVYNETTHTFFVPTFANEIYCLRKTGPENTASSEAKDVPAV